MIKLNKITREDLGINKTDMLAHLKCVVCDSDHLATFSNLTEEQITERLTYISKLTGLPISHSITHIINLIIDDLETCTPYVGNYGLPAIRYNFSRHDDLVQQMDNALGTNSALILEVNEDATFSHLIIKKEEDIESTDMIVVSSIVFKKVQSLFVLLEIAYTNFYDLILGYYSQVSKA